MASTFERSFMKGVVWEGISFVITLVAIYWFYGDIAVSLKFTFWLTIFKMFFFFIHERIWKNIIWGKY